MDDEDAPQLDDKKATVLSPPVSDGESAIPSLPPSQVVRDPRALHTSQSFTETEFTHKHTVHSGIGDAYEGVHLAGKGREQKSRHHHHRHSSRDGLRRRSRSKSRASSEGPVPSPADRVKDILGEDSGQKGLTCPGPIFSEMEEYSMTNNDHQVWQQTARWIKFEEDVEEAGGRFSKPHVGTLSLHALFELRSFLLNGALLFDTVGLTQDQVMGYIVDRMISTGYLALQFHDKVKELLMKRHRHAFEAQKKIHSNANNENHTSEDSTKKSTNKLLSLPIIRNLSHARMSDAEHGQNCMDPSFNDPYMLGKGNTNFMRKVPHGSEACNILIGETDFLPKSIACFVRLSESHELGDLTEVPVPTRFIFILLGTTGDLERYHEVGRAMGTLMSDEVFREIAYKATRRDHIISALDEFLDAVTVLPPGEWDPSIRIEPPDVLPSQEGRKFGTQPSKYDEKLTEEELETKLREETGLVRTGRFCGGLINDLKRKLPYYALDFRDGLSMQSVASWLFLYFGCLTPIVTFGGLLGDATEQRLAAMESLVAGMVCGIGWGLFSGQPLTILGSTGPVLVFETILYDFCDGAGWDYLSFRLWTGLWVGFFLLLFVLFDISALVCYITRFTEENFATLIGLIFMYEAIMKLLKVQKDYPIEPPDDRRCLCMPPLPPMLNSSIAPNATLAPATTAGFAGSWSSLSLSNCTEFGGTLSEACLYEPNVFFMSVILFMLTYLITHVLKGFKEASFFPSIVRRFVSDFAVIIAIFSMTALDYFAGVATPKLTVPEKFSPTWSGRGWLIPLFNGNAWWTAFAACIPALLATILIFMDQQITAVIVNRRENKLKKGCGYHLDLFVLACLIILCSFLGLPFFVAATVLSVNHVKSLTLESDTAAPGEKPQFLGILEQRVTQLAIFFTIGISVFLVSILKLIPMPVLYGIFLFMGASSLKGLQFFDRILIMLMPAKYQPDLPYLRKVRIRRVHLFTAIQLTCLVFLWVIKSVKQTKMLFPVMLVVMIGVRKLLDKYFTRTELKALDDVLPEFKRKERDDVEEAENMSCCDDDVDGNDDNDGDSSESDKKSSLSIPTLSGNIMKIQLPTENINLSEEVKKCGAWTTVNSSTDLYERPSHKKKRKHHHHSRSRKGHHHRQLSHIREEDRLLNGDEPHADDHDDFEGADTKNPPVKFSIGGEDDDDVEPRNGSVVSDTEPIMNAENQV